MADIKTLQGTVVRKISVTRPPRLESDSDSDPEYFQSSDSRDSLITSLQQKSLLESRPSVNRRSSKESATKETCETQPRQRKISCIRPVHPSDVALELDSQSDTSRKKPPDSDIENTIPFTIPSKRASALHAPLLSQLNVAEFEERQKKQSQSRKQSSDESVDEDRERTETADATNAIKDAKEDRPLRQRKISKFHIALSQSNRPKKVDIPITQEEGKEEKSDILLQVSESMKSNRRVKFKVSDTDTDDDDNASRDRSKSEIPDCLKVDIEEIEKRTKRAYGSIDTMLPNQRRGALEVNLADTTESEDNVNASESEDDFEDLTAPRERTGSGSLYRCNQENAERDLRRFVMKLKHPKAGSQSSQVDDESEESDSLQGNPLSFYNNIHSKGIVLSRRKSNIPLPPSRGVMNRRKSGVPPALVARKISDDKDMKMLVYKKCLQALLYPLSCKVLHDFIPHSLTVPKYCFECQGLLWGVGRTVVKCTQCGVQTHKKCIDLVNADCLQCISEKKATTRDEEKRINIIMATRRQMEQRQTQKPQIFNLICQAFKVDETTHEMCLDREKQVLIEGASNWSATVAITVECGQGLVRRKDKRSAVSSYVTVQVGKVREQTRTVYHNHNPAWGETFTFECQNSSDRIKVRVWDSQDGDETCRRLIPRKYDDLLGHVVIDYGRLSGQTDIWYNLERVGDRRRVPGALKLRISVEITGTERLAPYHEQYSVLHESLFKYLCGQAGGRVTLPQTKDWKIYFQEPAQEIVNEFAWRYGIESIYRAMTHLQCLSTKYMCPGVPAVMSALLANINAFYAHCNDSLSPGDRFAASNFGKDKFIKLMETLQNSLRIDLNAYRNTFPGTEPSRLEDLRSIVDLLTAINFFRMKVLGVSPSRVSSLVQDSVRACIESTYKYLHENCEEIFSVEYHTDPHDEYSTTCTGLQYWHKLATLLASVIEEDKTVYTPVLNQFPHELNVGHVSAALIWELFSRDFTDMLSQHSESSQQKPAEFINLYFKVKWLHKKFIEDVPPIRFEIPSYPPWFETFVMRWLEENDQVSMNYLFSAFERDKKDGFQKASEHVLFSCSVTDVFTQLSQCLAVLKKLECPIEQLHTQYMLRFSQTVHKVLLAYSDLLMYMEQNSVTCISLNNIQQVRVQLEKLYENMGGEKLNVKSKTLLADLQHTLNGILHTLVIKFTKMMAPQIKHSITELGIMLRDIKGSQAASVSQLIQHKMILAESDYILRPLMDFLDNQLSMLVEVCEKSVLKRLLKELWKMVVHSLEKMVVLAPLDHTCQDMTRNTLNMKQLSVLEAALDTLRDYFHADGNSLKERFLLRCPEMLALKQALALYTQSSGSLIKVFVQSQTQQVTFPDPPVAGEEPVGEVSVQVDIFTYPGNGEHKVTVNIVAATDLKWETSSMFAPFIEVHLIGPHLSDKKRKLSTRKSKTWSPKFNETFTFIIGNQESPDAYELHICAKDYNFTKKDYLIGVSVLNLGDVVEQQGSLACWCMLGKAIHMDETGQMILRILSQRCNDEIAKEFVRLKSEVRHAIDS